MALVKYNDRSLRNLTTAPAAVTGNSPGALVHIKTLTASSSGTLSFVNGSSDVVLDSTYPIYKFEFINCHPSADAADLTVNFRDGGSNYDATKTTTFFWAYHDEGDSDTTLGQASSNDLSQSTAAQPISANPGNDNDQCCSGELFLFNPSSTTFVKHFIATSNSSEPANYSINSHAAGHINVTAAIDGVQFAFESGNIDAGTIIMYGIKDS